MARIQLCAAVSALAIATGGGVTAQAASADEVSAALAALQQQLATQGQRLSAQEQLLAEQKGRIEQQKAEIAQLRVLTGVTLSTARGAGVPAASPWDAPVVPVSAPPEQERMVAALAPEGQGVLTPKA